LKLIKHYSVQVNWKLTAVTINGLRQYARSTGHRRYQYCDAELYILRVTRHICRWKHYVIGLSTDCIELLWFIAESLRETEVSVHVDISQLSDVGRAVGANEVRQCRRDLLQLIHDYSLVRQLTQLHLFTSRSTVISTHEDDHDDNSSKM